MQITLSNKHFILDPAIGTSPFRVEGGSYTTADATVTLTFSGDDVLSGVVGATIEYEDGRVQHMVPMNPGQVANIQSDESGYGPGYFVFNSSVLVDSITRQPMAGRVLVLTHGEAPKCFPFTPEVPSTCMASDTVILMGDGTHQVLEHIQVGDFVMTMNGPKRVIHITVEQVTYGQMLANKKLRPIRYSGSFSQVTLSRQHRVLHQRGHRLESVDEMVLVSAIHIHRHLDGEHSLIQTGGLYGTEILEPLKGGITYMNLWLENHEVIFANGVPVESGWLGGKRAKELIGAIYWHKVEAYIDNHEKPAFPIWKPSKE